MRGIPHASDAAFGHAGAGGALGFCDPESGAALLGEMLDAWMFGEGLQELVEYDTRVRAVTADQMRDVARKYFDPEKRVEGIVRGVGKTV